MSERGGNRRGDQYDLVTAVEAEREKYFKENFRHLPLRTRWGWWLRWRALEEDEIWWDAEGYNFGFEHVELRCLCDLQMELLSGQLPRQVQGCGEIWPDNADVGACVHQEVVTWDEII